MKLVATREARQFLRAWRQAAIPTAFVAAVLSVPLLAGWRFLEQPEISGVRLLGAPLACVAVVPASYAWAAMVRKAPWLDSPGGFVIAAAGCALATLLGFVVAS